MGMQGGGEYILLKKKRRKEEKKESALCVWVKDVLLRDYKLCFN